MNLQHSGQLLIVERRFTKIRNHFHFKENYSLGRKLGYFAVFTFQAGGEGGNQASEVTSPEGTTEKQTFADHSHFELPKALWWFALGLSRLFPYALPEHLFNLGRELRNSFAFLPLDANLIECFKLGDDAP